MESLFDEPVTLESLLARVEALEARVMEKPVRERVECPPEIRHAWGIWNLHRAGGKGWTAQSRKLNLKTLAELSGLNGDLAERIVNQSIERGWTGLFAIKDDPRPRVTVTPIRNTVKQALAPTESPLDRAIAHARQLHHLGAIDAAERDRRIQDAKSKHGETA
jgi:hypothetical protein